MCVSFNKEQGALHLTREGGHSHRRIVHVDDATGWAVQAALLKTAEAHPNITLLPGQACLDLITGRHEERYSGSGRVWGVYALAEKSGEVHAHVGRATILSRGGDGESRETRGGEECVRSGRSLVWLEHFKHKTKTL